MSTGGEAENGVPVRVASVKVELDESQVNALRGMVRQAIRKKTRGQRALRRKHGDDYDPAYEDGRAEFYDNLYRALGGDPARITNRGEDGGADE